MARIRCSECGEKIESRLDACPVCGHARKRRKQAGFDFTLPSIIKGIAFLIIVGLILKTALDSFG